MANSVCVGCGLVPTAGGGLEVEFCDPIICVDDGTGNCQGLSLNLGCGLFVDDEGRLDVVRPFQLTVAQEVFAQTGGVCPIAGDDTEACVPRVEACYRNNTECPVQVQPVVDLSAEITNKPFQPENNPQVEWDFSISGAPFQILTSQPLVTQHSRVDSGQSAYTSSLLQFAAEVAPGGEFCFAVRTRFVRLNGTTLNSVAVGVRLQTFGGGA